MKITVTEHTADGQGRQHTVTCPRSFNQSGWFRSSEINRIIAAGSVELDTERYEKALKIAVREGDIFTEQPVQTVLATRWQDEPATERQLECLRRMGYFTNEQLTKGTSSRMIDAAKNGWAGSLGMVRSDGSM